MKMGLYNRSSYPAERVSKLLLALRLAIGDAVADQGPHCLILDDAFAFTDPDREKQIIQLLCQYAKRFQMILLRCLTDRYEHVGMHLRLKYV